MVKQRIRLLLLANAGLLHINTYFIVSSASSFQAFQSCPIHYTSVKQQKRYPDGFRKGCLRSSVDDAQSKTDHSFNCNKKKERILESNNKGAATELSRRQSFRALAAISSSAAVMFSSPSISQAGIPEIDSKSGELFSPKDKMLGGGSDAARGIKMQSKGRISSPSSFSSSGPVQTVYETRFIAYLSRFLLNFDPAASSWWEEQDFTPSGKMSKESKEQLRFAEFAESVEIGLADYFTGPYGSYASVQAAKAGLNAAQPATSSSSDLGQKKNIKPFRFFDDFDPKQTMNQNAQKNKDLAKKKLKRAKQGVLNLLALLQARYISTEEKRQLAILFSLVSDIELQPVMAIQGLLGEADNAKISSLDLNNRWTLSDENSRLSCRQGGGYAQNEIPKIVVDQPPSLGSEYKRAQLTPVMVPTTRVLRIKVLDGGKGYKSIPKVDVIRKNGERFPCEACAVMNRDGVVDSIIVLNPGLGYEGKLGETTPLVKISPPKNLKRGDKNYRGATAVAEMEYAISTVDIVEGGNGYISNLPPKITIAPPEEDPDWYVSPVNQKTWIPSDADSLEAEISSMTYISRDGKEERIDCFEEGLEETLIVSKPILLKKLGNDPLALLPSDLRPHYVERASGDTQTRVGTKGHFSILGLDPPSTDFVLPSARYRAYDPIFGGVGSKPVTKGAQALTSGEYTRLALSGAVCTVLVRTALNPLELVKTKLQLKNDDQIFQSDSMSSEREESIDNDSEDNPDIGTLDVIKTLIQLRGPLSLFQSADITFLASLVFGSLGFGATELFRRSFSIVFFDNGGGKGGEEITVLLAAALACVLTSLAAAPFEILRVRSMGYVEPKPVTEVFSDFMIEKRDLSGDSYTSLSGNQSPSTAIIGLQDIKKDDIKPLFSGFYPIVSRELPFAVVKFLVFDLVSSSFASIINAQAQVVEPIQVGIGPVGLALSASAGAIAGITGAFISHPADLILTLTSSKEKSTSDEDDDKGDDTEGADWKPIVQDLLQQDGGITNLFAGLGARSTFFFLVIGLQFFLYDYAKNVFQVGSEDLTLILDVFYAIRQGLVNMG